MLGLSGVDGLCVADALGQRRGRPGRDDGAVEVAGEGAHLVRAVALRHQLRPLVSDSETSCCEARSILDYNDTLYDNLTNYSSKIQAESEMNFK